MLKNNYHTHSIHCHHATLTSEEQILNAIKFNLESIGFSEHIDFPGAFRPFRLNDEAAAKAYIAELVELREKYKSQIKVLIGFESEALNHRDNGSSMANHIGNRLSMTGVDYYILGLHFYQDAILAKSKLSTMENSIHYIEAFKETIKKHMPLYLAHPDVFLIAKPGETWTEQENFLAKNIIEITHENNIPLGINVSGYIRNENYPSKKFFEMAKEKGCKAIIELDTHNQDDWDEQAYQDMLKFANDIGIELIEKLEI